MPFVKHCTTLRDNLNFYTPFERTLQKEATLSKKIRESERNEGVIDGIWRLSHGWKKMFVK